MPGPKDPYAYLYPYASTPTYLCTHKCPEDASGLPQCWGWDCRRHVRRPLPLPLPFAPGDGPHVTRKRPPHWATYPGARASIRLRMARHARNTRSSGAIFTMSAGSLCFLHTGAFPWSCHCPSHACLTGPFGQGSM